MVFNLNQNSLLSPHQLSYYSSASIPFHSTTIHSQHSSVLLLDSATYFRYTRAMCSLTSRLGNMVKMSFERERARADRPSCFAIDRSLTEQALSNVGTVIMNSTLRTDTWLKSVEREHHRIQATRRGDRTFSFVLLNPETQVTRNSDYHIHRQRIN
jgi:hypothetical protein